MGAPGSGEVGVLATLERVLREVLYLSPAASTYAQRIDRLHFLIILTTLVAATGIFAAAGYFIVRYRRRPGVETTPRFTPRPWMESLIIGVPLSFFLLCFYLGFRDFVWLHNPPKDALDVYVTGKQWMWKFSYPGGPNEVNVLTVPQGKPVRLLLTSRDVIHSFYVPDFRMKQDALPGRYTSLWFEAISAGSYQVLCAEFCGVQHSMMRARLDVLKPEEFDTWLAEHRRGLQARQDGSGGLALPPMAEQGRLLTVKFECLRCHTVDGTAHIGPTFLDLYRRQEKLTSGDSVMADEAYLTESMMDPLAKVVAGFNPVMPSYLGQLSGPEAGAIVEYIKSLRSDQQQPIPAQGPTYAPSGQ